LTIQLDKELLYSTFSVSNFEQLQTNTQTMAPSMVEYYLSDLSSSTDGQSYINKSNIQNSILLDEYSLYVDYNDDIYLEFIEKEDSYTTESLW